MQIFVDANVLVYSANLDSPFHLEANRQLAVLQRSKARLWISRQILREYAAAMTRLPPRGTGVPATIVAGDVDSLSATFSLAEDGPTVTDHWLNLLRTFSVIGAQIYDANIVATMLAHGIKDLLTFNQKDFARYGSLIKTTPT